MDKYLDPIKNNKWIGAILAVAVVIIALANFTDAVSKLNDLFFAPAEIVALEETVTVSIRINNKRSSTIEIAPFADYELTESQGMIVQAYEGGRLVLIPTSGSANDQSLRIAPNQTLSLSAVMPSSVVNSTLYERGAGSMHINISIVGESGLHLESIPLIEEALQRYFVEYTIAPNKSSKRDAVTGTPS